MTRDREDRGGRIREDREWSWAELASVSIVCWAIAGIVMAVMAR